MKMEKTNGLRQLVNAMDAFTHNSLTQTQAKSLKLGIVQRDKDFGQWKLIVPMSRLSQYLDKVPAETERICRLSGIPISYDTSLEEEVAEITHFTRPPTQEDSGLTGFKRYQISVQAYRRLQRDQLSAKK